ncbi:gp53-like domain-containing protein, partial [Aeromonas hydrophila]
VELKIDPAVVLATRKYVEDVLAAHKLTRDHPDASETEKGFTRYATQAEVNETTTANQKADAVVTVKTLWGWVKQASETILGMLKVSTQEQIEAGTSDSVAVTPKKLLFGFTMLAADNGYIRFPKWLGNFVIQWGVVSSNASGDCIIVFPDAHKTGCYCLIPVSGSNMIAAYAFSSRTLTQATIPLYSTTTGAKPGSGINIQYVTFGR